MAQSIVNLLKFSNEGILSYNRQKLYFQCHFSLRILWFILSNNTTLNRVGHVSCSRHCFGADFTAEGWSLASQLQRDQFTS